MLQGQMLLMLKLEVWRAQTPIEQIEWLNYGRSSARAQFTSLEPGATYIEGRSSTEKAKKSEKMKLPHGTLQSAIKLCGLSSF